MTTFKLEPMTVNTIVCNQADLKTAIEYLHYRPMFDSWSQYAEETIEDTDYPLSSTQHLDILPYLQEYIAKMIIAHEKLDQYVTYDHHTWIEEYVSSSDYADDYSYIVEAGNWSNEDKLNDAITEALENNALGYRLTLSDDKLKDFQEYIKEHLLNHTGYEVQTTNHYFANPDLKQFIYVDYFPIDEYEDQLELSSLIERLKLPEIAEENLIFLLSTLGIEVYGRDQYKHFYLHTSTDVKHWYGWSIETIEDATKARLDNLIEDDITTNEEETTPYNPYNVAVSTAGASGGRCYETTGSCSCCGGPSRNQSDELPYDKFRVFQAGWSDSDGVYYSRLCGDLLGNGCIYDVQPAESRYTDTINELSGGCVDDAATDYENFIYMKEEIDNETNED